MAPATADGAMAALRASEKRTPPILSDETFDVRERSRNHDGKTRLRACVPPHVVVCWPRPAANRDGWHVVRPTPLSLWNHPMYGRGMPGRAWRHVRAYRVTPCGSHDRPHPPALTLEEQHHVH
jgi:hypothetical protein